MRRLAKIAGGLVLLFLLAVAAYAAKGWYDAAHDAPALAARADTLIAAGRGTEGLGEGRFEWLLAVQDPGFAIHSGVDLQTAGAGITTMTQSLAKRVAFEAFKPGYRKLRQTTYAMGLERSLTKPQIAALFLDTVPMGNGPDGWMTGFYSASKAVFGMAPAELPKRDFLRLVAVMIAPGKLTLIGPDEALKQRVDRISRLVDGDCRASGLMDVWLDGCAE